MKKTGMALGALAALAVAWEFVAMSNPSDDIITITAFMRQVPCAAKAAIWSFVGLLLGHFYWR